MRKLLGRWRACYGANPLHLLALLATFALAGFVGLRIADNPQLLRILLWFAGAVVMHDLILFPLYALADRSLTGAFAATRRGRPEPSVPALNYVRLPLLGAGLTFVLFFPGIIQQGARSHLAATGLSQDPFFERWLLLVAAFFVVSGVAYAIRVGRERARAGASEPRVRDPAGA